MPGSCRYAAPEPELLSALLLICLFPQPPLDTGPTEILLWGRLRGSMGTEDENGGLLSPSTEWSLRWWATWLEVRGQAGASRLQPSSQGSACLRQLPQARPPLKCGVGHTVQAGFMLNPGPTVWQQGGSRTELSVSSLLVGTV